MTWEVNGSYDRQKRLPRLWLNPLQEEWSYPQWQTESSMQDMPTPVRPVLRAIPHLRRQTWSYRTLTGGTDFVTRHLPRRGRHSQVALGFSGPVLCSVA